MALVQQRDEAEYDEQRVDVALDIKVVIGLTHAADDVESALILLGVEALRAGKEALMWLTKDGINVATEGFAATVEVPDGTGRHEATRFVAGRRRARAHCAGAMA